MTLYMDVHDHLPEGSTATDVANAHAADLLVQQQFGVRYLSYWVDVGAGKAFCLIDAPDADSAHAVHRDAHGLVADEIYPVVQGGSGQDAGDPAGRVAGGPDRVHTFDAGDLSCATGLAAEFRKQIREIPLGDQLLVTTADASAKEDLPPLARMMGHTVRSIETSPDGSLVIDVERGR